MCGDLENRICRCVTDRPAASHMLRAELCDDGGSGRVTIAQDAGEVRFRAQRVHEFGWKGRRRFGKIMPVFGHWYARDFPMAGRRVLAFRDFRSASIERIGRAMELKTRRNLP